MKNGNGNKRLLFISFFVALVATVVLFAYSSSDVSEKNYKESIDIYVAANDLEEKHVINEADIIKKTIPAGYIPENAVIEKGALVNTVVTRKIIKGNYIYNEDIINDIKRYTNFMIPEGKMAQSIAVNENSCVSYNIEKGDHVDIIATFSNGGITKIILQNIEVISFGDDNSNSKPKTIILAVNAKEAEKLTFAESFGSIKLILRRYDDGGYKKTDGIDISKL